MGPQAYLDILALETGDDGSLGERYRSRHHYEKNRDCSSLHCVSSKEMYAQGIGPAVIRHSVIPFSGGHKNIILPNQNFAGAGSNW